MWIKVLLLIAIMAVAFALTRATVGVRRQALRRLLLAFFVVAAALSVLFPGALTRIANLVGVGRGTDLLLYALVIAFLSYVATSYRRTSAQSRQIVALAREIALLRAQIDPRNLHNSSTSRSQRVPPNCDSRQYDSEL
ncbi:DUF2304 domain-containing protein [Rarobacter incanus]|uniref:DUF2304 domain-containing protein n=1 Tax=Rarobacter incanus TaxID=153494 RepID=A0A542SPQ5_9MICO|nr:DUF2304 domain-containing protein [Rarobacter incanus]TQK76247.1 hypothetical protein FB389_0907 [Rarobacter incanus]